jgi:hypothetical protein
MPGAHAPAASRVKDRNTRVSHYGCTGITRHSRTRMVLTVSFVLSPVIGLFCHRRRRDAKHPRQLDSSVEESGPHDFAVRQRCPRQKRRSRPPHPAPNVRDDRETPLLWRRDGNPSIAVSTNSRSKIFFVGGLDRRANQRSVTCRSTKWRIALDGSSAQRSLVVPAKAGTHNHRGRLRIELLPQPGATQASVVMGPGSRSLWTTPRVAQSSLVRDDANLVSSAISG